MSYAVFGRQSAAYVLPDVRFDGCHTPANMLDMTANAFVWEVYA